MLRQAQHETQHRDCETRAPKRSMLRQAQHETRALFHPELVEGWSEANSLIGVKPSATIGVICLPLNTSDMLFEISLAERVHSASTTVTFHIIQPANCAPRVEKLGGHTSSVPSSRMNESHRWFRLWLVDQRCDNPKNDSLDHPVDEPLQRIRIRIGIHRIFSIRRWNDC